MQDAVGITLMSFGEGRRQIRLSAAEATVGEAVRQTGLSTDARRIALNGQRANGGTTVLEGDLVTLMPRVVGG